MLIFTFSATPLVQSNSNIDDNAPEITIVNPTEGYFHFSGIKLFETFLDLKSDTMGFGGFRVRPVQVQVEDDTDVPEDISVYMYVKEDEQGEMAWNGENNLFERKWIGPDLGVFTLNISAEDTSQNIAYSEMEVWYFCFIPE
jgi:hypothetical protein